MKKYQLTSAGNTLLRPGMIQHLALMVRCHCWRGSKDSVRFYADTLRSVLEQYPPAIDHVPLAHRESVLQTIDDVQQGRQPLPWIPCEKEVRGTIVVSRSALPDPWEERDVCRAIARDHGLLAPICDVDHVTRLRLEANEGEGRVDVSFAVGRTEHVVEIKTYKADHRVVGQIMKYMRSVGGLTHYNLFDHVQGWVVAPDFTDDAMTALSEIGVRCVRLCVR